MEEEKHKEVYIDKVSARERRSLSERVRVRETEKRERSRKRRQFYEFSDLYMSTWGTK